MTAPHGPDGALRGRRSRPSPTCPAARLSPHTHTLHTQPPLPSPSLCHSLVGTWKATRQKHPGSPCWSDRNSRLCFNIQCIWESWHTEARGRVTTNRNRTAHSANSDEAWIRFSILRRGALDQHMLMLPLRQNTQFRHNYSMVTLVL